MLTSISNHYRNSILPDAKGEILRDSDEQILGTDPEELAKYYYERHALQKIEEDPEREISYDVKNYLATISAHQRESFYAQEGDLRDFQCQRVTIEVPIVSNPHIDLLSTMSGDTYSPSYSDRDFVWEHDKVSHSFESKGYGFEYDSERIAQEGKSALSRIQETMRFKNDSIEKENIALLESIRQVINGKRNKIREQSSTLSELTKKIGIPLKKKDASGAQPVSVKQKPLVERIKPKPNLPEEYVLDEDRVLDIIEFLDNQAKNFESTPGSVKNLGEEDLRDLLLASLNSVFEGNATGETFSKKGKTDIYLRITKGNILIAECKIWGGKALYKNTIDQLRDYLTWRHNYGIMITFVRIKTFTKVLAESEIAIREHDSYRNGFRKINETHFVSNHIVDDDDKEVKIHHLFYHLA